MGRMGYPRFRAALYLGVPSAASVAGIPGHDGRSPPR
jgi:hypothetical protein